MAFGSGFLDNISMFDYLFKHVDANHLNAVTVWQLLEVGFDRATFTTFQSSDLQRRNLGMTAVRIECI